MSNLAISIPPLASGDRLTREEFERRYDAMPRLKKAELIEGIVYMASSLRFESHAEPHAFIITWLGIYYVSTPGVRLADNASVRLDMDNEVQPDALLRLPKSFGGRSQLTQDDYLEGAPELIVEVAASSAAYDLHSKRKAYCRNGVREYVIWRTHKKCVDWLVLQEGKYIALKPDDAGNVHSRTFPGLTLAVPALLKGDLAGVLAELRQGLQTPEHKAFIADLSNYFKTRKNKKIV